MATDIEISAYSIWADLQKIRSMNPLVHNITNSVVQDFTANALLALGASPIMSDCIDETAELVAISNALNINIGTPNPHSMEAMRTAIRAARELGKPVALDPVAVGGHQAASDPDRRSPANRRSDDRSWKSGRNLGVGRNGMGRQRC